MVTRWPRALICFQVHSSWSSHHCSRRAVTAKSTRQSQYTSVQTFGRVSAPHTFRMMARTSCEDRLTPNKSKAFFNCFAVSLPVRSCIISNARMSMPLFGKNKIDFDILVIMSRLLLEYANSTAKTLTVSCWRIILRKREPFTLICRIIFCWRS